ncbi:MAG: hypothetical protein ABJ327_18825 [Litoreibacter sp.]
MATSDIPKGLEEMEELRSWRLNNVYGEVKEWGQRPIEFNSDPRGTQLFSIEEMKRSFCRRFIDLAVSASGLLKEDSVVSAAIQGKFPDADEAYIVALQRLLKTAREFAAASTIAPHSVTSRCLPKSSAWQ